MNILAVFVLLMLAVPQISAASDEQIWKELIRESHSLHKKQQYDQAGDKAMEALNLAERRFGPGDTRVARTLKQLAYVYSYQRRYSESIPLLRRALGIIEENYGSDHAEVAGALSSLARHLGNHNERQEAQQLYLRAVNIRERSQGPEHLDLAYDLMALARYAQLKKEYRAAESLHTRALKIRIKHLKPDHGWIAESWSALARLYLEMERYEEAVAAQSRALAIKITRLGAQHQNTIGYRTTLQRMQAALARHKADKAASAARESLPEHAVDTRDSSMQTLDPAPQTVLRDGASTQIHIESSKPRATENARASVPDTDLSFSRLSGRLGGSNLRIALFGSLLSLFIALVLWRQFRRARKAVVQVSGFDTVQDMDGARRKRR